MNKKIIQTIPSIILYVCAGLLSLFAIWAYMNCAGIISQAKAAGQLASAGTGYDIISFYMANCGLYFVFALLLAAAGLILQKSQAAPCKPDEIVCSVKNEAADEELDEWFGEASDAANN